MYFFENFVSLRMQEGEFSGQGGDEKIDGVER